MIRFLGIHEPRAHLQYLAICAVDGTPVEIDAEFKRIEAWLAENAARGWRWYARDATEQGIAAGMEAHEKFKNTPLVQAIRLTGVPFIFEFDRGEDAVLFKMFFDG
jgi:hypothetical protein